MALSLAIERLAHAYGDRQVIRDLSLVLAPGRVGCLLGPSACGKTTVLRCIAGFEPVQAGTIALSGRPVSSPGVRVPPEQRGVGMMFQDYALFPHLTVARNVRFGLARWAPGAADARVADMLALVGLAMHAKSYPHELSGGQQQRVALARALAPEPGLLLLDEPFSNLDVELREKLSVEVRDILKATGTTALLVTHDQQEAFALADEIGILREGALEQWDSAYNLYHRPQTRFVADFIGEGIFLRGVARSADRVDTELGTFAATDQALTDGAPVEVLLRPDDIVHDDASPWRATVVAKSFRGAEFLYTLALASGTRLMSLVPSHHNHVPGEAVGIRLAIDHVVAFPAGPAQMRPPGA